MRRRIIATASSTIPAPTRRPTTNSSMAKRRNRASTALQADLRRNAQVELPRLSPGRAGQLSEGFKPFRRHEKQGATNSDGVHHVSLVSNPLVPSRISLLQLRVERSGKIWKQGAPAFAGDLQGGRSLAREMGFVRGRKHVVCFRLVRPRVKILMYEPQHKN